MFLTIHIILLLFALGSSAHSLSGIQIINGSDIYQIRERPNNIFEIIESKDKVPRLLEIIYFKINKTPYKDRLKKEKLSKEKEPDIDDRHRPYNGFQFLKFGPIEVHKSSEDDKNSKNNSDESKNDSSDCDNDSNDCDNDSNDYSPDSNESNNDSDDSSDSDSDSNESSPDSNESNNDSDDSSDSDSNSSESSPDSNENNNDSDGSNNSDNGSHESSPDSHESNNDSDESNNSENGNHESSPDSHESHHDSDESTNSDNGSHESSPDSHESHNDSDGSNNSDNGSHEISPDSHESHNDSDGSNNSDNGSHESNPDSHESQNNHSGSTNSDNGSHESNPDSHESQNNHNGSQIDNKESNNSNSDNNVSKESKNDGNHSNSGSNESKNESHENQINRHKDETDNNSESTADSDKSKDGSDAHKNNDDHDKDNEKKENNSEDTSKTLDGQKNENKTKNETNDNITPDVSQSTEPAEAVNKIKAIIQERTKQFNEAKEKYHEINRNTDNSTKLERRKRNIEYSMPPPPVLQPFNVRMLPDFIQRMITNIPALKNVLNSDERGESNDLNENGPQNYDFQFNDKGPMWNKLPFPNQYNYINEPNDMINRKKQEEYQENSPDSSNDVSNSGSDDNSLYSDNDSGYNVEPDEDTDKSNDDSLVGGVWPIMGAPIIDFNNFKPYPIIKENDLSYFVKKINKDAEVIEQPKIQLTTETNINLHQPENRYKKNMDKEPKKAPTPTPPPKTKININKDLKEKIEMSFDNKGNIVPPMITRFEENLVKTAFKNNETPLTYGMKLSGINGYVWNDLADPGNHYLFGETLETNKECNEPSSPATDKFNEYTTESLLHKDKGTTPVVKESSVENQTQKPTTESENLSEPNKESVDKDKDKSDDKKDNEDVQVALDDLLKKDEFWKWLTKWTAAYISVLNEHVEELVKREVAKQLNKTMSQKNEKEKDKIDTNNKDLINKNETIANVTTVEHANDTNAINSNITTTEKSIPEVNNTENIAPEKDIININKTASDGHKSNRTTPANAHTIYGNAIDSNHVTNIFIFYPNAENNGTAKDIEALLGNKNNNLVVLGTPSNDNKDSKAPDSKTNSPVDYTTGIYAIDPKKDIVSKASEPTIQAPESAISNQSSTADIPTTTKDENTTATIKADASNSTEASTSSNTTSNTNATTVDNATAVANGTTLANDTTVANGTTVVNDTAVANGTTVVNDTAVANDTSVPVSSNAADSTSANNIEATDTAAGTKPAPDTSTDSK